MRSTRWLVVGASIVLGVVAAGACSSDEQATTAAETAAYTAMMRATARVAPGIEACHACQTGTLAAEGTQGAEEAKAADSTRAAQEDVTATARAHYYETRMPPIWDSRATFWAALLPTAGPTGPTRLPTLRGEQ